jgi:hypothetical protein
MSKTNTVPLPKLQGDLPDKMVQRTVPANSVFALGRSAATAAPPAPERQRTRVQLPALEQLVIRTDRPMVQRLHSSRVGEFWAGLWARLQPGHSVDLTAAQAKSFSSWAKKNGCDVSVRKLDADTTAIWRNA